VVVEEDVVEGAEVETKYTGGPGGTAFGEAVVPVDGACVDPSRDAVGELVVAVGVVGVLPVGTSVLSSLGV
jgi:hypothetical protein